MLIHTHAHKEHSVTSVFGAQRILLVGEGALRKARHSSHVSCTNDTTATISFGSPVHQAKENWVIYTVNISYFLPQNNVWILRFKDFFLNGNNRKLFKLLHFNYLHTFNCSIKFSCRVFFFVKSHNTLLWQTPGGWTMTVSSLVISVKACLSELTS